MKSCPTKGLARIRFVHESNDTQAAPGTHSLSFLVSLSGRPSGKYLKTDPDRERRLSSVPQAAAECRARIQPLPLESDSPPSLLKASGQNPESDS